MKHFTIKENVLFLDDRPALEGETVTVRDGNGSELRGTIERSSKDGRWWLSFAQHVGHPYLDRDLNEQTIQNIEIVSSTDVYENPYAAALADTWGIS